MAAIEVSLLWTSRGGRGDIDGHNTYQRQYEVITDDQADDEQVVVNADVNGVAIPLIGEPLPNDLRAVVVSVEAHQSDESPYIWYVGVDYDTDPPHDRAKDKPDNRVDLDGNT